MRKILIAIALLVIVTVSGCIQGGVTGDIIADDTIINIQYYGGECRRDSDCLVVYCRDIPEQLQCMNTVQVLTEMKCQDLGGIGSEKNYELCGCIEGICTAT